MNSFFIGKWYFVIIVVVFFDILSGDWVGMMRCSDCVVVLY